jgi:very-short-patch-repair endonuclease
MPTRLTNKTFIQKSKLIHGDKYDYSKVNYLTNKIRINIICPEHGEFEQVPHNHLKGYGCYECGKKIKQRLTPIEFIDRSKEIHNDKFDYSLTNFTGVEGKVKIICPEHGVFKQSAKGHLTGRGCRKCNQSKGEREIYKLLKEKGVHFLTEHKFDDCRNINPLPFDFYLPDHNVCIEFDGKQHFISNSYFKHEKFEDRKLRDKIKNEYCHNNNIRLIRISYKEISKIEDIILSI